MSIQTRTRYDALDVMKFLCAIFVVVIHCKPLQPYSDFLNVLTAEGICRIAVPFFFCTSGLLLAERLTADQLSDRQICKQALISNIRLYALWSIAYLLLSIYGRIHYHTLEMWYINNLLRNLVIDGGSYYHFWYLLAMIYAMPLMPWLARRKSLTLVLMAIPLWTLRCLQFVYRWVPFIDIPWDTPFDTLRDAACCAVPMMAMGILCLRFRHRRSPKFWLLCAAVSGAVNLMELLLLYFRTAHTGHFEFLFTTPFVVFCLVNYLAAVDFSFADQRIPLTLRQASVWIYCIHPMLIFLYSLLHDSTGIRRFLIILPLCLVSSLGYIRFRSAHKNKRRN